MRCAGILKSANFQPSQTVHVCTHFFFNPLPAMHIPNYTSYTKMAKKLKKNCAYVLKKLYSCGKVWAHYDRDA